MDTDGELPILAIRLQIGADMLYWLANAADPAIWAMLDAWHAAGRMAVAAQFDNGRMFFVDKEYTKGPALRALRQRVASANLQTSTREFMQSAGEALLSGQLASRATSDIPSVASVRHVQGCTVCTETTGRILVPLEVAVSSACDLLIPESLARLVPPRQPAH
ncbi:hypothetical protein [Variovorax sp. Sphag1AA]|uniref:hypothetical protein n=1 Tax=Variovorax sp. Sphag1AA TaxID=2587027 RepID=UPI001615C257|nr:hypothetical protein [Variovorax sp. Sphag1AA]MBB3180952.1 hypothetical protein [Variovorax sp. Sphag1AA]